MLKNGVSFVGLKRDTDKCPRKVVPKIDVRPDVDQELRLLQYLVHNDQDWESCA